MLNGLVKGILQLSLAEKTFNLFRTLATMYNAASASKKFYIVLDYALSGALLITFKATVFVLIHWVMT